MYSNFKIIDTYVKVFAPMQLILTNNELLKITAASQSGIEVGKSKSEIVKGTTGKIANLNFNVQKHENYMTLKHRTYIQHASSLSNFEK